MGVWCCCDKKMKLFLNGIRVFSPQLLKNNQCLPTWDRQCLSFNEQSVYFEMYVGQCT